jgi:hypothetical protein
MYFNRKMYWSNRYIFKHITSQSFLRYYVFRPVLTGISLVTHSKAQTILWRNCFTFYTFARSTTHFTNPQKKKSRGIKFWKWGGQTMGHIKRLGNSLPRKVRIWQSKRSGAPFNWKQRLILTGWFYLISLIQCRDSISKYDMTASFRILTYTSFIIILFYTLGPCNLCVRNNSAI